MSRCYKIVLLLAMLDDETLVPSVSIGEITRRVADLAQRIHRLTEDFSVDLANTSALQKLLIDNPIDAFVTGRGMGGVQYFKFNNETFAFAFEINDLIGFARYFVRSSIGGFAQYLSRGQVAVVICRVSRNTGGQPILFLPSNKSGGHLPQGNLDIEVDGRPMEAIVAKIAVNVVRPPGASTNELPAILRTWFGEDVGLPGRSDRVRFRRDDNTVVMEPFDTNIKPTSDPKVWERYPREAIPPAFGLRSIRRFGMSGSS